MLPSEKLELAIYKAVNRGAGPVTLVTSMPLLSQLIGQQDHAAIADRLKALEADHRIELSKWRGDQRLPPFLSRRDEAFFHTGSFGIEIIPQGRKYFEELEQRAEEAERSMRPRKSPDEGNAHLMPPKKAIEILKQMLNNSALLSGEPFGSPKREEWTGTSKGALARAFAAGSPILDSFRAAQAISFTAKSSDEELRRVANDNLSTQVAVLKSAIEQLGWELGEEEPVTPGEDTAIDDLLPVLRRRMFDQDLEALGSSASEGEPVSLLMLDLDHFKAVNDTHGHPVGDEVLIECANIVARRCRNKGKVYRFGGEEIAVLLPNFMVAEAVALAESIRSEIEKGRMSSKKLAITASVGAATTPTHATDGKQLLKVADEALYAAKRLGRNLVRIAGEDTGTQTDKPQRVIDNGEIHLHVGQPVNVPIAKIPKDAKPGTVLGPFKLHVHGPPLGLKERALLTAASILDFVVRREKDAPPYPSSDDAAAWSKEQEILRTYDARTLKLFRDGLGKEAISTHDQLLKRGFQDPALDRLYNDPGTTAGIKVIGQKLHDLAQKLPPDEQPRTKEPS